jgi:hypothetical protein
MPVRAKVNADDSNERQKQAESEKYPIAGHFPSEAFDQEL